MSMFQKRSTATVIFVIGLILLVLIGLNLSVSREAKKVDQGFTDGVDDPSAGFHRPGIETQLNARIDAALGLITCCCDEETLSAQVSALRSARQSLLNAHSVQDKYSANESLEKAWAELAVAMDEQGLDMTGDALVDYYSTMIGTQTAIQESGYNASVAAFYQSVMGTLPVRLLRLFVFVDLPQYFGAEG